MKQITLCIITIFIFTLGCKTQKKECFEIKYLDFFGIDKMDTLRWSESELNQLLKTDYTKSNNDKENKTNFLIPIIMLQLKAYYPECEKLSNTTQYNKLIQLYFKICQQNKSIINGKTISEQLEFIREDYYTQVLNDKLLPFMNFTMDDGPLYGQSSKSISKSENIESIETDFGKLSIIKSDEKFYLSATNINKQVLWTKIMTGTNERILNDLSFAENPVLKTSRGYIIHMASGEVLTLYLNLNGEFMYYYHSW